MQRFQGEIFDTAGLALRRFIGFNTKGNLIKVIYSDLGPCHEMQERIACTAATRRDI